MSTAKSKSISQGPGLLGIPGPAFETEDLPRERLHVPSLPNEVLSIIFSFIYSPASLLRVALTCKRFAAVVRPFQYRSIDLSLVASRPHWIPPTKNRFDALLKILQSDDLLRSQVTALSVTILKNELTDLCEESATLAHILPNLGSLRLSPPPMNINLSGHTLLHSLYIDFNDSYFHFKKSNTGYLSQFLRHPSLRNLHTRNMDLQRMYLLPDSFRDSPVTTLRLRDVEPRTTLGIWIGIIDYIRALKFLTLDIGAPRQVMPEFMPFQWVVPEIGRSLAHHAETLVELIIATSDMTSSTVTPRTPRLGSMTHYTALKRLGIPERFLTTRRKPSLCGLLPSGLVVLQLQHEMANPKGRSAEAKLDHRSRMLRASCLAECKESEFPLLARFIWWEQKAKGGTISDFQEREVQFREKGVEFTYVSSPFYAATPLAAEEAEMDEEDQGLTRWNPLSEEHSSLSEVYGGDSD